MSPTEKSCGCIIIEKNKVLLIQQKKGHWSFPKGHVEKDETDEETAIREIKEETNLDVEIEKGKIYKEEYIVPETGRLKEVLYFIAKKVGGTIKLQEEEVKDAKWLEFYEALKMLTYDNTRDVLRKVLKDKNLA